MKKKREENVELADIQAVRERMTQWAIRLWLLLIPVIVGIILSTQGESTTRAGNFIVRTMPMPQPSRKSRNSVSRRA